MTVYDPEMLGLQISRRIGEDEVQVFCPYHSDSRPSAEYNLEKGLFFCFGCQESKTAKQLANDLGGILVEIRESLHVEGRDEGHELDWTSLGLSKIAGHNEYLESRDVHFTSVVLHQIKQFDDGIIFPILDRWGEVSGYQVRRYTKKPKYMFYGKRQPVWPLRNLARDCDVFVVEGVFGVLRAERYLVNAVATMGASSVGNAVNVLTDYDSDQNIYIVMDQDYAGLLAAGKYILRGLPAILTPWTDSPDEWNNEQWSQVMMRPKDYVTNDVNEVIYRAGRAADQERMERTLENYWRKL